MSSNVCNLVDDSLPSGWTLISAGEFIKKKSASFNIAKEEQRVVELYSVPSHETGLPEILDSKEIGSNKQYVSEGDILLSKINPRLNRAWVVGNHSYHDKIASTEWIVFEKNEKIIPSFLKYALTTNRVKEYLAHNSSGVGGSLTRVKPVIMNSIFLGVPSIDQQKRIVAKIEELFSELDNGIAALKTAREQLKVYRQAVLKHAFEGKLTAKWREENQDKLETPEQLLARIQQEREARYQQQLEEWTQAIKEWEADGKEGRKPTKPTKPATLKIQAADAELPWCFVNYEGICELIRNGISAKPTGESGVKIFRISAVRAMSFDLNDIRYISNEDGQYDDFLLKNGDLVFTRYNGTRDYVGVCAEYKGDGSHLYPDKLILTRLGVKSVLPGFLEKAFATGISRDFIEGKIRTTAGQSGVSGGDIKSTPVPICSLAEQQEIVNTLEEKLSNIEQNEKEIEGALAKAELLRQSILKKAFSGKLVPEEENAGRSNVLPFPGILPGISERDLHAGIIALAYQLHEDKPQHLETFGYVKAEKISHMVEYHLGISLGRSPVKDVAGPNDYPNLRKTSHRADKANWFHVNKTGKGNYVFIPKRGFAQLQDRTREALGDKLPDVEHLIQQMLPMTSRQAEVLATVYAAWNNLLLMGVTPDDERIVTEARENWHESKLEIERSRFFKAIQWMRKNALTPSGRGSLVTERHEKL